MGSEVYYHGTPHDFEWFDLNAIGSGNDTEGPGIYFSTDLTDARSYAFPNGYVWTVRLHLRGLLPLSGPVNRRQAEQMLREAPDLVDDLTNWDENPKKAFQIALNGMLSQGSPKEVFEQIWYDFYRRKPALWLEKLVKFGYDGFIVGRSGQTKHAVVFNLDSIEVVKKERYKR